MADYNYGPGGPVGDYLVEQGLVCNEEYYEPEKYIHGENCLCLPDNKVRYIEKRDKK